MKSISVVMPCFNEEEGVGYSITEAKKYCPEAEIIVINNNSTDRSKSVALVHGATVYDEYQQGYGFACRKGIDNAKGEIIVMMDCDGSYDFSAIPKMIKEIKKGNEFIIGNRKWQEQGAIPKSHRYLGNPIIKIMLRLKGIKFDETCTGMIASKKKVLEDMDLKCGGMEFSSEVLVKTKGLKTKEIDISFKNRIGKSKLNEIRDGLRHLKYFVFS